MRFVFILLIRYVYNYYFYYFYFCVRSYFGFDRCFEIQRHSLEHLSSVPVWSERLGIAVRIQRSGGVELVQSPMQDERTHRLDVELNSVWQRLSGADSFELSHSPPNAQFWGPFHGATNVHTRPTDVPVLILGPEPEHLPKSSRTLGLNR